MKTRLNKKTIVTAVLALVLVFVTVMGAAMPTVVRTEDPAVNGTSTGWSDIKNGDKDDKDDDKSNSKSKDVYTYADGSVSKRFKEVVTDKTNKQFEITVVKSGVDNKMNGQTVHSNSFGTIDVTHANEGYVTLVLTKSTDKKVWACVDYTDADSNKTYYSNYMEKDKTYNIPMYFGSGKYTVSILEDKGNGKCAVKLSVDIVAKVNSELDAFLASTHYANYADAPKTVAKAAEITKNCKSDIEKINVVYNWVIDNITCKTGHHNRIPGLTGQQSLIYDLDVILEDGKGACGEISALVAGMLRSQDIPCKVVCIPGHMYIAVWKETGTKTEKGIVYATGSWVALESTLRGYGNRVVCPDNLKYYG